MIYNMLVQKAYKDAISHISKNNLEMVYIKDDIKQFLDNEKFDISILDFFLKLFLYDLNSRIYFS